MKYSHYVLGLAWSVALLPACKKDSAPPESDYYTVSTLAGRPYTPNPPSNNYADGPGSTALFYYPDGVATDAQGNVYVAEFSRIRKITPAGIVSTVVGPGLGSSPLNPPPFFTRWLALDAQGNLYLTGLNQIRKLAPSGTITTITGGSGSGMQDGDVSTAKFNGLQGIALDQQGNLYVADQANHRIRKITPAGMVSTLAGSSQAPSPGFFQPGGYVDGPGQVAQFRAPTGIATDLQGNVYVTEMSDNLAVRKITPAGVVSTFAKIGALYSSTPYGITVDAQGNVFVTEQDANLLRHRVHKITPSGEASVIAGGDRGYADGSGTDARFTELAGIATDGQGNLYVADGANHSIRKISRK
jgi:sugar lactone lactonase YvrE